MRGLKPIIVGAGVEGQKSHPLRMRGLKQALKSKTVGSSYPVASFADAWIETSVNIKLTTKQWVASFADAWIETRGLQANGTYLLSHPLRMRGLKLLMFTP